MANAFAGGETLNSVLQQLEDHVENCGTAPQFSHMPRRSLADKGIAGPTSAHVIEEIHTPFNFAFLTVSTGSTAFQNIIGVTMQEYPARIAASHATLRLAGVPQGSHMLITYPPLVNVFLKEALEGYPLRWNFLQASSRDALLLALCRNKPDVVVGESRFLRATLEDAKRLGLAAALPQNCIFLAAGTPLDTALIEAARELCHGEVHDLYGCQEFGWLTLDGIPLREDISLLAGEDGYSDLAVGGLATGDRFPILPNGHACGGAGNIISYGRKRSPPLETILHASTAHSLDTVERLCAGILRIKARIVRPAQDIQLGAAHSIASLVPFGSNPSSTFLQGPSKTHLLDSLLQAQMAYQSQCKTDPAWTKPRE